MPSRILEMVKASVNKLPQEKPKPQQQENTKPIKEPKIKTDKQSKMK
jgi:hypothetical protein